jgi:hypothetical protein
MNKENKENKENATHVNRQALNAELVLEQFQIVADLCTVQCTWCAKHGTWPPSMSSVLIS